MDKGRQPEIVLKTDERDSRLEPRRDGKFVAKSMDGMKKGSTLRATSSRSRCGPRPLGADAPSGGRATAGGTASMLFFAATETALHQ
jgi:hypothetical protein